MTRTPKLPTQWVIPGTHPENARNTAAILMRTSNSASRHMGKLNILNSVLQRLRWNAKRPNGGGVGGWGVGGWGVGGGGIKLLIMYRN